MLGNEEHIFHKLEKKGPFLWANSLCTMPWWEPKGAGHKLEFSPPHHLSELIGRALGANSPCSSSYLLGYISLHSTHESIFSSRHQQPWKGGGRGVERLPPSSFLWCVDTGSCTHTGTRAHLCAHMQSGTCRVELKPLNVSVRIMVPKK